MADKFDEIFLTNFKQQLLERIQQAEVNELVLVDECLLNDIWPASDSEHEQNPNIRYSYASVLQWCSENKLDDWKPIVVEKTDSEHHNLSTGQKYFRPMALKNYSKLKP